MNYLSDALNMLEPRESSLRKVINLFQLVMIVSSLNNEHLPVGKWQFFM